MLWLIGVMGAGRKLQACDQVGIEFLEQPLPVAQFDAMLELSDRYSTQLALDESVATLTSCKLPTRLARIL